LDAAGNVIPEITPVNYPALKAAFGGSAGMDVTGGMETKVSDMLALTEYVPQLSIRILNGTQPDLLRQTLLEQAHPGTLIRNG
jgi:isopentenyl phosphate kinase